MTIPNFGGTAYSSMGGSTKNLPNSGMPDVEECVVEPPIEL